MQDGKALAPQPGCRRVPTTARLSGALVDRLHRGNLRVQLTIAGRLRPLSGGSAVDPAVHARSHHSAEVTNHQSVRMPECSTTEVAPTTGPSLLINGCRMLTSLLNTGTRTPLFSYFFHT